jgi:hypothetical protein
LSGYVGKSWCDIDSGKTSSRRQSIFCPPEIPHDLYLGQTQTPDDSHLTMAQPFRSVQSYFVRLVGNYARC